MEEKLIKTEHLVVLIVIAAAVAIYGMVTMQYLLSVLLIALMGTIAVTFIVSRKYFSDNRSLKFRSDFSTALFVAVFVAFFGMAVAVWLVWAVALTALFLILQSLARIERRLDLHEEKGARGSGPVTGEEEVPGT